MFKLTNTGSSCQQVVWWAGKRSLGSDYGRHSILHQRQGWKGCRTNDLRSMV